MLRQNYFRGANTLNGRVLFRQGLSLFRTSRIAGLDASYSRSRGLSDLTASAEERINEIGMVEGRLRLSDHFRANLTVERDRKYVFSDAFSTRQFDLRSTSLEPGFTWSPSEVVSVRTSLSYSEKSDALNDRTAVLLKAPVEFRFQRARQFQFLSRLETASVTISGAEALGLASFELTDGRGEGRSFLWNLTGEYLVNQYLRASITYDGRKPSTAPVLHTVRMQLSASF